MAHGLAANLLRWIAYLVAAAALLYLVGANLILNTKILEGVINKKPEKTLVEWQSGWTLLPGFIHVEGLRVRGQSKGQQWQFRLGEADVRMSLWSLASRSVRASQVRGKDFHFRLRPRLSEETGEVAAHYPPIEGLSNPPVPAPEDLYPPKPKKKRGWHIDVSDVYLEDDIELWVGDLKMTGTGSVAGGVDYQLREDMYVPGAVFDLDNGEIAIGGTTFVNDLHIATDLTLGPFDPKESKGLGIFQHVIGQFTLENGTIPDIELLNRLIMGDELKLVDGTASFSWAFNKESVGVGSSGHISIAAENAAMLMGGRDVSGDLAVELELEKGSLAEGRWVLNRTTLELDNMDIRLLTAGGELAAEEQEEPELWWAHFTVEAGVLDIGEPSEMDVTFDFELKNTEPLLRLFMAKEKKDGGAKLPFWAKVIPDITNVEGRGRVAIDGAQARMDEVLIQGDNFAVTAWYESKNGVSNGKLYLRYKKLDLGLDVENGKSDLKILRPKKWALEQPGLDHSVIPQD